MTYTAENTASVLRIMADEIKVLDDTEARFLREAADRLDAQSEELAALRRNRAAWEASGLAMETKRRELELLSSELIAEIGRLGHARDKSNARVRELEGLLRVHAALCCDDCNGTGQCLGEDDRDGPCERCGGSGCVLPADVAAAIGDHFPGIGKMVQEPLPASRGTTSGELLQMYDREENKAAYAVADSEGGEA